MEEKQNVKKPITKRWWFWGIVILIAIGIIGNLQNDTKPATEKVSIDQTTIPKQKEVDSKTNVDEEPKKEKYEIIEHKIK